MQNVYKQTSVNTASSGRLLIMLFDGLLRFIDEGSRGIVEGNVEKTHRSLLRAQDIVLELRSTLDKDKSPELAENLYDLYSFFYMKLVETNRTKADTSDLDLLRELICSIRDAFVEAEKQQLTSNLTSAPKLFGVGPARSG